ncbi:MAG: hypothetical protein P1U88_06080 [Thalassobaculaceae bacterium]|nr:hypothetical protein [Thalassobaculaceae bacterium]
MDAPLEAVLDSWIDSAEPRAIDQCQHDLTEKFLLADPVGVERFFGALRAETDTDMASSPVSRQRIDPYPKGFCREINDDMLARLRRRVESGDVSDGAAVIDFIRAGGLVKPIWGDLRGSYFQNATQLGALYVDVSNDTVDVTKPKVEIMPLAQSGMRPIRSIGHYIEIVGLYWNAPVYPNTLLPALSPMFPVLVNVGGTLVLGPGDRPILAYSIKDGFREAEAFIQAAIERGEVLPAALADAAAEAVGNRRSGFDFGRIRVEADAADVSAAFSRFRAPGGPVQDLDSFSRFLARARQLGSVDLLSVADAINPPDSGGKV